MKDQNIKKPYVRIDFINCDLYYDYTICPWSDVPDQMQIAESNFIGIDESDFKNTQPQIKLSVVFLTDEEWGKEIESWDI